MAKHNYRPKATKREGLLVEEVGDEVLVYNVEDQRVHCLNDAAVRIWKLCNGRRTVKQIAAKFESDLTPAARELVVRNAAAQFARLGLVKTNDDAPADVSRRDLARRIGIGAAAAVVLPLITSIMAPTASAANSLGASCSSNPDCATGCCCGRCCKDLSAGNCSGTACVGQCPNGHPVSVGPFTCKSSITC